MADLPFPLEGSTLVLGPSDVGKTTLTARALDAWVAAHGPAGTVVLEFAPVVERDGRVLGGRLTRFTTVPDRAWHGVLEAHAPRTEARAAAGDESGAAELAAEALRLARANADRATDLLAAAPDDPNAVFVNDATIPFHAAPDRTARLTDYCDGTVAVLNALESQDLSTEDAVSRNEQAALDRLQAWADRVVRLD